MVSFYHLPSTIVKHPTHRTLYVAYSFYNVALTMPLKDLILDALIIAKKVSSHSMHLEHVNLPSLPSPPPLPSPSQLGFDVFNALDVMDNKTFLEELKFGVGDGNLHYYFYNWRCPEIPPEKVLLSWQLY